jgi:hypothetical protein
MSKIRDTVLCALVAGGAAYIIYKAFECKIDTANICGCTNPSLRKKNAEYGTIPLPENVESWLYVKNPETRGSFLQHGY